MPATKPPSVPAPFRSLTIRLILFALLWWILTEGASPMSAWGIVGIAGAVGLSMHVFPAGLWNWRLVPLIRFVPYFLWQSLLGGLDVAYRALRPKVAGRPEVISYSFSLRQEPARVFFLWMVSLLPGTAAMNLQEDKARVHVLDANLAAREKLEQLEKRIAGLFGEQ